MRDSEVIFRKGRRVRDRERRGRKRKRDGERKGEREVMKEGE